MVGTKALGKYQILRSLGRGSNAEVFLAQPLRSPGHLVVVKRVHDHIVRLPQFRQLFDAEVRSMANFAHPYVVRLLEAAPDGPFGPCLVMEYVPGETLEDLFARHGRFPAEQVGRWLGYVCHALQAAHAAGVVHRDLKPANLMVGGAGGPGGTLKVMDFGFAGFAAKPHIQLAELTGHGPIFAIGTPGYVSPEMIRGDAVDGRSDLYSLGVMLFELLSGRLPFVYDVQDEMLAAHVRESPPRFHRIGCAQISPTLEGVVQLALSKYPNERQQSAKELADGFGAAIGSKDLWESTAPPGHDALQNTAVIGITPPPQPAPHLPPDPYRVQYSFDAFMPERMAAAKLRGFVEDLGGEVLESAPGLILLRLGLPPGYKASAPDRKRGIFGWLHVAGKPSIKRGLEPIEVELHLAKPDPYTPRLKVLAAFRPTSDFPPNDPAVWRERCDRLHAMLRQYLGT